MKNRASICINMLKLIGLRCRFAYVGKYLCPEKRLGIVPNTSLRGLSLHDCPVWGIFSASFITASAAVHSLVLEIRT